MLELLLNLGTAKVTHYSLHNRPKLKVLLPQLTDKKMEFCHELTCRVSQEQKTPRMSPETLHLVDSCHTVDNRLHSLMLLLWSGHHCP